jgi:hypothetical protein
MELEKVLVIDPVTNVEETYKTKEVVYKSNVNKSLYQYNADSFSNTNIIFNNITPPSLNTIIPRCLKIEYQLQVSVTGNAAAPSVAPYAVDTDGYLDPVTNNNYSLFLADSPLQASCTAIELRINGSSTSISPNDYIMLYSHMVDNEDLNGEMSTQPHQKDNSPYYQGWASDVTASNAKSPFAPPLGNSAYQANGGRVFTKTQAAAAGNGWVDIYNITVQEDLYLSPSVWGRLSNMIAGYSNINNLTVNIRIQNLKRAVRCESRDTGAYLTGVTAIAVALTQQPKLNLTYITPDPVLAAKMPSVLAMDYSYIQPFITSSQGTTIGEVNMNSIRLPSIPKRIFVYAKPAKSLFNTDAYNNTIPDIFLPITNIKITFNNRINLLANDNAFTLYQKSVANGLKDTFQDWQYYTGSVMIIDVAKDLGLEADESSGQANKYSTLQIRATFTNANLLLAGLDTTHPLYNANNWDFYVLVESPGKAFVTPSDCQFVLTGPSSAEVLALTSSMDKVADHSDLESKQVGGGAFGLGKLFKSGLNLVKNINPEHVAQGVKAVQGAMGAMGLGVAGGAMGKHKRVY